MSRIFLIEDVDRERFNLHSAEKFGTIVILTKDTDRRPSMFVNEYNQWLDDRLREYAYDGENDYLLICGHVIAITKAVASISSDWETFKALAFDGRDSVYRPIVLGSIVERTEENETIENVPQGFGDVSRAVSESC